MEKVVALDKGHQKATRIQLEQNIFLRKYIKEQYEMGVKLHYCTDLVFIETLKYVIVIEEQIKVQVF